jgi:short-subunit dehydrogenase
MDHHIHVSCIQPTYFKTNISRSARGGAMIQKITQRFIEKSGLDAKEVSQEILIRAGKKELYIIMPKQAYKMWLYKRFAPTKFRTIIKEQFMTAMKKALRHSK